MMNNLLRCFCALVPIVFVTTVLRADTIYVDATATPPGNGESWATAYTDLQSALNDPELVPGDQIWVAHGTYRPVPDGSSDRTISFALIQGVSIMGGFFGDESSPTERGEEPLPQPTILSGDLAQNDDPENNPFAPILVADNSYHVVTATMISEIDPRFIHLDRVTISGGRADVGSESDLTLASGAGAYLYDGANVRLNDVTFTDNSATSRGAGAAVIDSYPSFTRCTFDFNHVLAGGSPLFGGGGLYIFNPTPDEIPLPCSVYNCTFSDNLAEGQGGGGIMVDGNHATPEADVSRAEVINGLFYANTAQFAVGQTACGCGYGGAVLVTEEAVTTMVNCTFGDNIGIADSPGSDGGQVSFRFASSPQIIRNCILWRESEGNGGLEIGETNLAHIFISDTLGIECDIAPGSFAECIRTFDIDPQFVDPNNPVEPNYRVLCTSDAVDAGHTPSIATDIFDLNDDGFTNDQNPALHGPRSQGGKVDIGAYELVPEYCPADINNDDVVNVSDLLLLLAGWGPCPAGCAQDVAPCIRDDMVDVTDLLLLLSKWGPCDPAGAPIESHADANSAVGISQQEWDDYQQIMQTGTQQQKDEWTCWYEHLLVCGQTPKCQHGSTGCPGDNPFQLGIE